MNVDTHEVWRDELPIELTATEFNLLRYLLENARRVISKSELLDNVWGFDFHGDPNIVETYISYLRKKIDDHEAAAHPHHPACRLHPPPAPGRMSLQKRLVAVVALLLVHRPRGRRRRHVRLGPLLPLRPGRQHAGPERVAGGFNYLSYAAEPRHAGRRRPICLAGSRPTSTSCSSNRSGQVDLDAAPRARPTDPTRRPILTKDIPVQQVPDIEQPRARRALRRHLPTPTPTP